MINNSYILIPIIILLLLVALKVLRVQSLKFTDWLSVAFLPEKNKGVEVAALDRVGFVISQDSKIYKIHVKLTIKVNTDTSLNNVTLLVVGLGKFVFRQFFEGDELRIPTKSPRLIKKDEVQIFSCEFEPMKGWNPIRLSKTKYRSQLIIRLIDKVVRYKFSFQVRPQNLTALNQADYTKGPIVIEVPIIS